MGKKIQSGSIVNRSLSLPPLNRTRYTPLAAWRHKHHMSSKRAAEILGVSIATYYRYEAGFSINMSKANIVVKLTNGEVRYRDLIDNFIPEYA